MNTMLKGENPTIIDLCDRRDYCLEQLPQNCKENLIHSGDITDYNVPDTSQGSRLAQV